ncbi:hypothetical protein [Microbacterium sp. H6]|uniref:hypothetical protein n=1 Tax=Microbacterium sp. H6 TaxID=421122 RepID=UPI000DE57A24|nr:hypothetical protein [Microbacterium sp. H6]RBO73483.1 hypothetical protein DSP71_04830 [Microbacterium sp. H6]
MSVFTATNGMTVERDHNGDVILDRATRHPSIFMGEGTALALREFFQRERDEANGVWRSQIDPAWTAVHQDGYPRVKFRNDDGMREFSIYPDRSNMHAWSPELQRIGLEYLDARPERKPWEDAQPGEVWALGMGGGYHCDSISVIETAEGIRFIWGVSGGAIRNIAITDRTIDYGKRVFPPEDES